jgi:hypothetical protein
VPARLSNFCLRTHFASLIFYFFPCSFCIASKVTVAPKFVVNLSYRIKNEKSASQLLVLVHRRIHSMTATYCVKNTCACQINGFVQVFAVDGRKPHGTCIVLGGLLLDYCNTW